MTDPDREMAFDRIVRRYYESIERGDPIESQQLIAQYPEFREELVSFLADVRHLCETADASENNVDSVHNRASIDPGHKVQYVGEYEILDEIARGGMGVVYRARHEKLRRLVALKMILSGRHAGTAEVERFVREARAAASLRHGNIVRIHEIGTHDGHHFFTMDLVEGDSLAAKLRIGSLSPREAAELLEKLARAVHYAREQGVLHRDLKPGNVLLDVDGEPQITDFGLAKSLVDDEQDDSDAAITQTGQVLGTPSYMAPEQAAAKHELIGVASDTYSLGAMLYASLGGRPPFVAESNVATLRQVIEQEPLSLRTLNPRIPVDLETICQKCLEKSPSRRYASAEQFADDLRRFLEGKPVHARRISALARTARWCRRQPIAAALIVSLVALAVGGIWFGVERYQYAMRQKEFLETEQGLRRHAERLAYASDLKRAQLAWDENDVSEAASFVRGHENQTYLHGFEWNFWHRRLNTVRAHFPLAPQATNHVDYRDDGGQIASTEAWRKYGREDQTRGSLSFWDAQSGERLQVIETDYAFNCVDWHPDGTRVATSRPDNVIQVWDASTGTELLAIGDPVDLYETLSLPAELGSLKYSISFDPVNLRNVVFSPDGARIAAPGEDFSVCLWDAKSGALVHRFSGHDALVVNVAHSEDGRWLESASVDGTVKIWDVRAQKLWMTIPIAQQSRKRGSGGFRSSLGLYPFALDFHPDGNLIAIATTESEDVIWIHDVANQQPYRRLVRKPDVGSKSANAAGGVTSLDFCADGSKLVVADRNRTITIWDVDDWSQSGSFKGTYWVDCVAFHPGGTEFASTGSGINVWDVQSSQAPRRFRHPKQIESSDVRACAVSPDGRYVASSSSSGMRMVGPSEEGFYFGPQNVDIWELASGRLVHSFPGHVQHVDWLFFSSDQRYLISGGRDRVVGDDRRFEVFVWDLREGKRVSRLELTVNRYGSSSVAFSAERGHMAYADGRTVRVLDPLTGAEILELPQHDHSVDSVAWLGDDRLVVLHSLSQLSVWSIAQGQPKILLSEQVASNGTHLAISPNGQWLAVAPSSGEVVLLASDSCSEQARIRGINLMNRFVFSPDSRRLATVSDNAVQIWDVYTGRELLSLPGDFSSVTFGSDGKTLVGGVNGGLVIWEG